MTRLQTRPVSPVGFRQGDQCRRSSVGRAPDFVSRYVVGPSPTVCTTPVQAGTLPHQGGGIATRPVSRHLRKRRRGKWKIATFVHLSVHLHRVLVLLSWRTAAFVGSIPTFRTRGAQTPRFRSGVPQYAVAVRSSTGFSSFFPAPVGIQAGQLLSNGGAVRGRQPRRPYGALAQSAEQAAHNGPVPGSNPRCPTSHKAKNLHKKRKKGGTFQ